MAAAAGLRALGAKGSGWLRRGPWAPLTTGFCSGGPAGIGRPEPGPRPTIARQRDGIRDNMAGRPSCCNSSAHSTPFSDSRNILLAYTVSLQERNIVLSDPKRRNALSLAMLKSLQSDILHEAESQDLKVIIISAEGPVFSSGHDLKELTDEQGPDYHAEVFQTCSEVMMLIQNHPVPIIAMVNGLATAAGCQLVASCDIAVASDKSSFATPGVNIGVFCSTPAVALGRAVPRKVALEMLFTGEPISAQEALLHGLLSRVVPEERLEEETMRIARKVASLSRSVLSLGKAAFYRQLAQDLRTAYHLTSQTMVDNLGLPDGQEGVKAFLQKRKPVWSH
uniref:Enoyl-CoA hydratase domain-containing protein 3, mitochondrial n=3 Tax=Bos TaxID=9903 RepID=A0A8C0AAS6_BOSMU